MKSASPTLLLVLLAGGMVFGVGLLLRGLAPASFPWACTAAPWLLTVGFLGQTAVVFLKAYRIQAIFNSAKLTTMAITDSQLLGWIGALLVAANMFHLVKVVADPNVVAVQHVTSNDLLTFHTCSSGNYLAFPVLLYGSCFLFLLFGVNMGVQSRNVPAKFNESSQIALVIFAIAFLSVTTLMVSYGLSQDGPTAVFLVETVGLALGALVCLGVIFVPKLCAADEEQHLTEMAATSETGQAPTSRRAHKRPTDGHLTQLDDLPREAPRPGVSGVHGVRSRSHSSNAGPMHSPASRPGSLTHAPSALSVASGAGPVAPSRLSGANRMLPAVEMGAMPRASSLAALEAACAHGPACWLCAGNVPPPLTRRLILPRSFVLVARKYGAPQVHGARIRAVLGAPTKDHRLAVAAVSTPLADVVNIAAAAAPPAHLAPPAVLAGFDQPVGAPAPALEPGLLPAGTGRMSIPAGRSATLDRLRSYRASVSSPTSLPLSAPGPASTV